MLLSCTCVMMLRGRRKASVALFFLLALTSFAPASSLTCVCKEYLGSDLPVTNVNCNSNATCDTTTGRCFVDLRLVKLQGKILHKYLFGCVENSASDWPAFSLVHTTCEVGFATTTNVLLCCNDTDLCNQRLEPHLHLATVTAMAPSPTPAGNIHPTSTPSGYEEGMNVAVIGGIAVSGAVAAMALSLTVLIVFVYCLRRRKLQNECVRRVPQGMKEAGPTGEMELMDMTVTSGSGSGLPCLIQRTVARTIKITELIGNGRYGQVYLGYYQGEPVAVKKFFSRDEKSWCRETEIYNTLLLRHDNILGFFASDMVSNNGVTELWLITQYHQFGSLYDFLFQEAVSPKVMLQMAISTCSGLAHLHTELFGTQAKPAIAHRDMKTKNVLVKNNMTCCIADFGLAVFKDQNEMNIPTNPKQGTKRYMAPEILNETINMKSFESFKQVDVYALGLVLWELCRRSTGTSGVPEDYEVPLQGMVPPDPSFDDMKRVVVVERRQPTIPPRWHTEELLREITKVMRECWYYTSTARPTAVYLKKKLLKMAHELEKMNYGDLDVQQAT